jgi:tetratricopeptide (TPR) repeat protein
MAKLQIKYRLEGKALPPRPIKIEVPGWGGSSDFKKVNGSQPQPWHCPLHVEGCTHGVELLYQYDQECHVINDGGHVRILWDRAAEGLSGASEFTLSVPPPSINFLFATGLDLQAPPGYVLRTEPHPRFFADMTGTAPCALYGHLHTEWWPKKIFIVFKIPEPGHRHIFRKGEPYCQVLFIPADDTCELTPMNDRELERRRKLEEDIKLSKSLIAKQVWHSAGGVEFNDHYKVLSRAYEQDGMAGIDKLVNDAVARYEELVPKGLTIGEYFDLAGQRIKSGKRTQAKELLHHVMRMDPDNPEVYNRIALLQWDLRIYEDALRTMRRAISIQPRWHVYHYNLGEMLRRLGQVQAAEDAYRKALELKPDDAELVSVLGLAMAQRGAREEGLEHCRRAALIAPQSPVPLFRMGVILAQMGRTDEARVCLEKALAVDPSYTPAAEGIKSMAQQTAGAAGGGAVGGGAVSG